MAPLSTVTCSIWFAGAGIDFVRGAAVTPRVKLKVDPTPGAGTANAEVEVERVLETGGSEDDSVGQFEAVGE